MPKKIVDFWNNTKDYYTQELEKIESQMQDIIKNDSSLEDDMNNLLSITGVGKTTAMAILSEIPNINDFNSARQFAAFVGLVPRQYEFGTSVYKRSRISKMGSGSLRKALFFPAISAMTHSEHFKEVSKVLSEKGKAKKSIVCAIMRRLTHVIFGVLKHKEKFNIEKLRMHNKKLDNAPSVT